MEERSSVFKFNRRRALIALISSIVMMVMVFTGLIIRLFDVVQLTGYTGTQAFRLFTIDSNLLVGICATLSIPYQIDGLRTGNYHMPRWIIYTLYVGVSAVAMTFVIAVGILAPVAGFEEILFSRSNLFFHFLNPVVAIVLFCFIACDHRIPFKTTFCAMMPVFIYATVYIVMVFIIGEDNGGWQDHYRFGKYIPWPLTLILMLAVIFGICTALRVIHNAMHQREKRIIKDSYQKAFEFQTSTIEEAVIALADDDKKRDPKNNEVVVPRRIIGMLIEKFDSKKSIEELCELYLHEYLK